MRPFAVCTPGAVPPTRNCTFATRRPSGKGRRTCCGGAGIISRKLGRIIIGLVRFTRWTVIEFFCFQTVTSSTPDPVTRMVKKLDLLESDHGCGPNGLSWESMPNGSNTTLHGPQLTCNVFLAAVRRVGTSPMDSA